MPETRGALSQDIYMYTHTTGPVGHVHVLHMSEKACDGSTKRMSVGQGWQSPLHLAKPCLTF